MAGRRLRRAPPRRRAPYPTFTVATCVVGRPFVFGPVPGTPPPCGGASGALTPTEERVAELAGQGLRNAEIATRLCVTPKTVEATPSRVYRKLGVRSRTELARRRSAVE